MQLLRPAWVEIDLDALRHNVRVARELVGPAVKLIAVCKGDGYGCGAAEVAKAAVQAGADALSVGNPYDVIAIRRAGILVPIVLYASTLPEDAAQVADLGAIVTIHDFDSLQAFASLPRRTEAFIEIDSGFGRLGFRSESWRRAFNFARQAERLRIVGVYTHFTNPDDRSMTELQAAVFRAACVDAESAGLTDLTVMCACSRTMIGFPELHFAAADTGRMLYGALEGAWERRVRVKPVLRAVKSRIIQVKELPEGRQLGYGKHTGGPVRVAVIPIGFGDGFPWMRPDPPVLVHGHRAPIVGRRSMEHTVVDISHIPAATVGNEVVLLGRQGNDEISVTELVEKTGVPLLELLGRLGRALPRVYVTTTAREQTETLQEAFSER